MRNATTAPRLVWRRNAGTYQTTAPLGGEADAFRAYVTRDEDRWYYQVDTHGRDLTHGHKRTLAEARDETQTTLNVIWVDAP
jgi:hypothetical protein